LLADGALLTAPLAAALVTHALLLLVTCLLLWGSTCTPVSCLLLLVMVVLEVLVLLPYI
jgi:hypothetical protein